MSVGRPEAPVLIDQEGGRVTRLKPPVWRALPAPRRIGSLYGVDAALGLEAAALNARLIAADLQELGIDVNCVPVLDVPVPGSNDAVVGDRAFGGDPLAVAALGKRACEGCFEGGVLPVIKHFPGHGRATVDSHAALPVVDAPLDLLRRSDFVPFRALANMPCGMVAHLRLDAVDDRAPASQSARVIEHVIRGEFGFDGLLFSDDIGMGALGGSAGARAARTLAAGCDVTLHCSGNFAEMLDVAANAPPMTDAALARFARARAALRSPAPFDRAAGAARLDTLLAQTRA